MSDETKEVQEAKTPDERKVSLVSSIPIAAGERGQLAYQTESAVDLVGIEVDAGLEITRFVAGKSVFKRVEGQSWNDVLVPPDNRIPGNVYVMIVVENLTSEEVIGKGTLVLANEEVASPPVRPSADPPDHEADKRTSGQTDKRVPREATAADSAIRRRPSQSATSGTASQVIRTARTEAPPAQNPITPGRLERLTHQVVPNSGERAISLLCLYVSAVSNWLDNEIPLSPRVRTALALCLSQEIAEGASTMGDNEIVVSLAQADVEKLRAFAAYEGPELSEDAKEDAELRARLSKAFREAAERPVDQLVSSSARPLVRQSQSQIPDSHPLVSGSADQRKLTRPHPKGRTANTTPYGTVPHG